jgi:hypothetical protein
MNTLRLLALLWCCLCLFGGHGVFGEIRTPDRFVKSGINLAINQEMLE